MSDRRDKQRLLRGRHRDIKANIRAAHSREKQDTRANPNELDRPVSQPSDFLVNPASLEKQDTPTIAGITAIEAHEVYCSLAGKPCNRPGCTVWAGFKNEEEECDLDWYPVTLPDPLEKWCSICNDECGSILCKECFGKLK